MTSRASAAGGQSTLFDHLVQHERGTALGSAPSLRPRLRHPFEHVSDDGVAFDVEENSVNADRQQSHAEPQPIERGDACHKQAGSADLVSIPDREQREPIEPPAAQLSEHRRPAEQSAATDITLNERVAMLVEGQPPLSPPAKTAAQREQPRDSGDAPIHPQPMRRLEAGPTPPRQMRPSRPKLVVPGAERGGKADQIVEIHIGRIDVRAAAKQAEPPPTARASHPPVDRLAAYLQRRSRGARS
jgi:hypothetical protein